MAEITKPVNGAFCWTELNTTDPGAAQRFYATVLGWAFADMPSAQGPYTVARKGEGMLCGLRTLADEAKKMGAPPHWLGYVAVADCDAVTAKGAKLGGKVLVGPMDAGGMGRMSLLQDPTGGVLGTWQEQKSMGTFLHGEDGALCWNELTTNGVDAAGKFYTSLFGWKSEASNIPGATAGGSPYITFKNGTTMVGGLMQTPAEAKGAPSMWTPYFHATDVDAQVARAKQAGGQELMPVRDLPTVGRYAYLRDPQGAVFALIKFAPPAK